MKRILLILSLYCFVIAQISESPAEIDYSNSFAASDFIGEELSLDEDIYGSPDNDGVSAQPFDDPVSGGSADDSYLDDLIGDQPVIERTPAAPAVTSDQIPEEPQMQESEPDIPMAVEQPSTATAPVRNYSSSPDIDPEEIRIQETPDIPQFSHKSHIEDVGAECVQCHQTLFSELVKGYRVGPSMKEICSQCHNGTDAPSELLAGFSDEKKYVKAEMSLFSHTKHIEHTEKCTSCHTDIYSPLKKIKSPPPMSDCMKCHNNHKASGNCRQCHEDTKKLKPRSHNPRWVYRNGHGTRARYNQKKCRECHAEQECNLCHRGQSSFAVHRPGYKLTHGMDARRRVSNCAYCHDVEYNCAQCHTRKR